MSKKRKKKRIWPVKFRDTTGKVGLTIPSNMTLEQCVRLGIFPQMVPKGTSPPDALVFDPEKDMPPGV